MIVQVTGGREYDNEQRVREILSKMEPGILRHGDARGADRLCGAVAAELGWVVEAYPVLQKEYDKHRRGAPLVRNSRMAAIQPPPDVVIAFTGGSGTADMVKKCLKKGFRVVQVAP